MLGSTFAELFNVVSKVIKGYLIFVDSVSTPHWPCYESFLLRWLARPVVSTRRPAGQPDGCTCLIGKMSARVEGVEMRKIRLYDAARIHSVLFH